MFAKKIVNIWLKSFILSTNLLLPLLTILWISALKIYNRIKMERFTGVAWEPYFLLLLFSYTKWANSFVRLHTEGKGLCFQHHLLCSCRVWKRQRIIDMLGFRMLRTKVKLDRHFTVMQVDEEITCRNGFFISFLFVMCSLLRKLGGRLPRHAYQ